MARDKTFGEGRFCEQQLGIDRAGETPHRCGGELRHARRVEGEKIVPYLICLFCGGLTRLMEYHTDTGEIRTAWPPKLVEKGE